MKILVTGGAGFIGSHVVDGLISRGYGVVVVDNLSIGKREYVNKEATFYNADINDKRLEQIFKKEQPQIVNHHAAQKNLRESIKNPVMDLEINGKGTLNLLELCVKFKVARFVYASSGGAIYDNMHLPVSETSPIKPLSPYGITKMLGELYLQAYKEMHGLDYVSLRYSNVYGPRQDPAGEAGVIAIFSDAMQNGRTPVIYGDGMQTRDFVYVGDVVKANILATENENALNHSFNISTCKEASVNELFAMLKKITAYKGNAIKAKPIRGEMKRIFLSYEKAKRMLGWQPQVNLEGGLKKTIGYMKET